MTENSETRIKCSPSHEPRWAEPQITNRADPHWADPRARIVLDSWVVSQIWLDSESNESSQSRVGRENQGYELSQSRITLIVSWVRVESSGYGLSQSLVTYFSEEKTLRFCILPGCVAIALPLRCQDKNQPTATSDRSSPRSTTFGQIRWNVMSRESELTQFWLKMSWVGVESG